MVSVCPTEADPRLSVAEFISNSEMKALTGLHTEGLESLMDVIEDEIRRQEPDSILISVDRDFLVDEGICFLKEFESAILGRIEEGKKVNIVVREDIPVKDWQSVFEKVKLFSNVQAFYGTIACRQIPLCTKL